MKTKKMTNKTKASKRQGGETLAPATLLGTQAITLTENEIKYLATSPDGLSAAMDYHDMQMTQGEPMGFDCSEHQKRYDELKRERDAIKAAWEGVPNADLSGAK